MAEETLNCPTCRKPVAMSELGKPGSAFPFCSDRCRLVDLNRWLTGRYQIPVEIEDDSGFASPDDDPPRR